MKNVFPIACLMVFATLLGCKDKNAQAGDKDISSLPIHTSSPTDPRSVASKLETATSAVKDKEVLVWAGDVDPVCKMKVKEGVTDTVHYGGKLYGFCGESCKESFQENPHK